MLNEKSVTLLQVALGSRERIMTVPQPQVKAESMVQWLKETADAPVMMIGDTTDVMHQACDASDNPVPAEDRMQKSVSCSEPAKAAGAASAKHVKKLHRRIDALEREVQAVKSENRDLRQHIQNLGRTEREARSAANELSQELASVKRSHQSTQMRLKVVSGKELQLRRTSLELKERIRGLEHENADLVDTVASLLAEAKLLNEKLKELQRADFASQSHVAAGEESAADVHGLGLQAEEDVLDKSQRNRHVVSEELGFLDQKDGVCVFRFAGDGETAEWLSVETTAGFEMGDTVKRVLWSDGHIELVPLQHRSSPRPISIRSFPRKRRIRQVRSAANVVRGTAQNSLLQSLEGDIIIVGGDCPARYTEGLRHLGRSVLWHNGFEQRGKLEQLLRRASLVVTIETQVSHWAMWRIKELAKANHFVWRQVKVKSLSSVTAAVMDVIEATGAVKAVAVSQV